MRNLGKRYICALFMITNIIGCLPSKSSKTKSIIGDDDRKVVVDPLANAAIGTLHIGRGSAICTAFASGPDEVITAGHCLVANVSANEYEFRTNKHGFRKLDRLTSSGEKSDVAVFKSQQRTADFLPISTAKPTAVQARLIGFDFKSLALVETLKGSLDLIETKDGIYRHTFDTVRGQSGSPIIQDGNVVAVHVGSVSEGKSNIAVSITQIDVANVRRSYPEFRPEGVVDGVLITFGKELMKEAIKTIVIQLVMDNYEPTKALITNYVAEVRDRVQRERADRAFRESALDRNNPGNLSPGGWAGPDFDRGADSRGSAIALIDELSQIKDEIGFYVAGAIGIIYREAYNRHPNEDEMKAMAQHVRNGASYGFLKSTVFNRLPIHDRHGNNGTVSCDTFCSDRRFTSEPGSCVGAKISTNGRGVHCAEVPGLEQTLGGELTCNCLGDGFSKPGNNGTVSCRDFCWGEQWGAIGNCLAAYRGDAISCDTAAGTPQDCVCGAFRQ